MTETNFRKITENLLKIKLQFLEDTYLIPQNKEFRENRNAVLKVEMLFGLYRLNEINVDFSKKGTILKYLGDESIYSSTSVWYLVKSGKETINDFICSYFSTDIKSNIFFDIDNDKLVITDITKIFNTKKVEEMDTEDVLKMIIAGGETELKNIIDEFNKEIGSINKRIYQRALEICSC